MDYYFEQLGDERFQKLCQAILTSSFPDVLCLPVGQPDGGRDALVRSSSSDETSDNIIFQVKFVKDPNSKDSREFIKNIIKTEKEKVNTLKSRGAQKYYLMTNTYGTSHLDNGSIDQVNKELSLALEIEAYCWWRDDLNRRMDANSSLKWSFPETLKASDLLENLLNIHDDVDSKRRSDIMRSYMAYQAKHDAQLKFKQVELQKGIIDQYVDIPLKFLPSMNDEQELNQSKISEFFSFSHDFFEYDESNDDDEDEDEDDDTYGALELMVQPEYSKLFRTVVVEGAPGQGKSTVTQYLCQVNRLTLLGRKDEIKKISAIHLPKEARIPFRIDLRDYASWLSGKNPFIDSDGSPLVEAASLSNPILESFIAAQINRYTGSTFNVDDLTSLSKSSQLLIVLDGFDEVADIKTRNKIVSEVCDAAIRISENALSSQIIVTSRPTAFANSPGFPRNEWQHVKLLPLSRKVIELYAEKWLNGRSLEEREKNEIRSVLQEKLTQSHVRDLAKNPMQLAILLALISVQGASLPDKRTALYDNYIDIFLNRESEKSRIVRDHRDLLVQIHRYLAWVLQSEAEAKSEAGNISESKLRVILKEFLSNSGHPPELVDEIFSGMVERVVALVSRVQGTYEFEVQPLREYFAARYLYDTAPYSPAGTTRKGTLPERFDAIARNFYWLNVTRFYAGCYSSGELSSLVDGLENLTESFELKRISQPSRLGVLLLKDYVFNQQPKIAYRLVKVLTQSLGFRTLLADLWVTRYDHTSLNIPAGMSRNLLTETCKKLIEESSNFDTIYVASKVLVQNSSFESIHAFWNELGSNGATPLKINQTGSALGVFEKISSNDASKLIERYGSKAFISILRHQRLDLLEENNQTFDEIFLSYAKNSGGSFFYSSKSNPKLSAKNWVANAMLILAAGYFTSNFGEEKSDRTIRSLSDSGIFRTHIANLDALDIKSNTPPKISKAVAAAKVLYATKLSDIKINLRPWNDFIEAIRDLFGECLTLQSICILVMQTSESEELYTANDTLLGFTTELKKKISNDDHSYWKQKLISSKPEQYYFLIISMLMWGSPKLLLECQLLAGAIVDSMDETEWRTLANTLGQLTQFERIDRIDLDETEIKKLKHIKSDRLAALFSSVLTHDSKIALYNFRLKQYQGLDSSILKIVISLSIENAWTDENYWPDTLEIIKNGYNMNILSNLYEHQVHRINNILPLPIAIAICDEPTSYPIEIITAAESIILASIGQAVIPVGKIAAIDSWFDEVN
jgi:hypothetical protein